MVNLHILSPDGSFTSQSVFPDAALAFEDEMEPFFVLEAFISQTRDAMLEKARRYVQGSKGHVKILAMVELRKNPDDYNVLLTIWRIKRGDSPDDMGNYCMDKDVICSDEEVYPSKSTGSFTISLQDILPDSAMVDVPQDRCSVEIPFSTLHAPSQRGVTSQKKLDIKNSRGLGPDSSLQDYVSPSSNSSRKLSHS